MDLARNTTEDILNDPRDTVEVDEKMQNCGERQTDASQDLFTESGDVDFRGVSWPSAAILIAKFQIGLGALSLPATFETLGFFPGILCFLFLASISTVAGYVCGNARQYYPQMHSIADAAGLMFGRAGQDFVGTWYYIYLAMTSGAGMLTTSIALNTLSEHGTCTLVLVAVPAILTFLVGGGFRSLEKVAWISWVGVAGIFLAIWITAIACLVRSTPASASVGDPAPVVNAFPRGASFSAAMTAVSNQLFAVGASGTFFSISAEMKHPEHFTRALLWGQGFIVTTCIVIASIVYGKVGQYLASPALQSAGPLIAKISYGIALPGLVVTSVLFGHIAAKYIFVRVLRGKRQRHLQSSTPTHWTVWLGSMAATSVFAFLVVCLVPFFSDFLSLVGALVNPVFTNVVPGFALVFYVSRRPQKAHLMESSVRQPDTRHWFPDAFGAAKRGSWVDVAILTLGLAIVLVGFFIMVGGTYATILSIQSSYDQGAVGGVFSCADNSS